MRRKKAISRLANERLEQMIKNDHREIREANEGQPLPELWLEWLAETDMLMTRDDEKKIILDAVSKYVLSCTGEEVETFVIEMLDTIRDACLEILIPKE